MEIEEFFTTHTRLTYKRGEIILRAGVQPQGVLYIKKGYVRQYAVGDAGSTLILHIFKPGSFFPMTWVVNDTPNTYYFDAITPVEIWRAPRAEVREYLRDHPPVMYDFASRLLSGVTGMMRRMESLVMDSAYNKTVLLLLYLANVLGEKSSSRVVLPVPVTHREIAAWIGTTRETASLQVENLKKKRLISYRKRQLIIPSLRVLEKEIQTKN